MLPAYEHLLRFCVFDCKYFFLHCLVYSYMLLLLWVHGIPKLLWVERMRRQFFSANVEEISKAPLPSMS